MDHKQIIVKDVFSSLLKGNVKYEIAGPSVYFGYDMNGSAFFKEKTLQTRTEGFPKDYLRVLRTVLHCLSIETVNPRAIWLKCKLDEELKLIQVLDVGSNGVLATRKKCSGFLDEIGDIRYGHFYVMKNPAVFSYLSKELDRDIEEISELCRDDNLSLGELENDLKKILFQKIESIVLSNGISKIDDWDVDNCRSFLLSTKSGDLRIFRRTKNGGV